MNTLFSYWVKLLGIFGITNKTYWKHILETSLILAFLIVPINFMLDSFYNAGFVLGYLFFIPFGLGMFEAYGNKFKEKGYFLRDFLFIGGNQALFSIIVSLLSPIIFVIVITKHLCRQRHK